MLDQPVRHIKFVIAAGCILPGSCRSAGRAPARPGATARAISRLGVSAASVRSGRVIVCSMTATADGPSPRVSDLRLLYEAGASVRVISRATGIPPRRFTGGYRTPAPHSASRAGSVPAPQPRTLSPAEIAAAVACYEKDGLSLDKLGARYGRSGCSMGGSAPRRRRRQAPRPDPYRSPPQLPAGLWELHLQGLRPADIAARTPGTTAAGIARALHSAGLAPHRGRPLPSAQGLAADYARAGSVRALARELHADEDRLRGALAAAGVPAGSLRRIPVQLRRQVAVLAATGASSAQIARHTGLPVPSPRPSAARRKAPAGRAVRPDSRVSRALYRASRQDHAL